MSPKYFGILVVLIDITGTINAVKKVAAGFSLRLLRTLKGAATKSQREGAKFCKLLFEIH